MKTLLITITLLLAAFLLPTVTFAHQPRIVNENATVVTLPEVSNAHYGTLDGKPAVYFIRAEKAFVLYVGVLVPDIAGQKKMSRRLF